MICLFRFNSLKVTFLEDLIKQLPECLILKILNAIGKTVRTEYILEIKASCWIMLFLTFGTAIFATTKMLSPKYQCFPLQCDTRQLFSNALQPAISLIATGWNIWISISPGPIISSTPSASNHWMQFLH